MHYMRVLLMVLSSVNYVYSENINNRDARSSVTLDVKEMDILPKVDEFIETILRCRSVVAMNLAIVQNGETLVTKGYGPKDLNSEEKVTADTLFGIASMTKAFTTTLLGTVLHEHG